MEVHPHTHTPRKKWSHYFWEFLMLFLAVFCGFMAENQREHMIEHQREKQFMASMLEDLRGDSILLVKTEKDWEKVNRGIDSVSDAIQLPPGHLDLTKAYKHINNALNYWSFAYNDRTIAQLKNSGGFRLINNKIVANKIVAYNQFNNDAIIIIKDQHNSFYERVVQLRNKIFVQEIINEIYNRHGRKQISSSENMWIDSMINKNRIPLSMETQIQLLFEFKNSLLAYRQDFSNMQWAFDNLKFDIGELINLIEENYQIN